MLHVPPYQFLVSIMAQCMDTAAVLYMISALPTKPVMVFDL